MTFDIKLADSVLSVPVINDTFAPIEILMEQETLDADGKTTGAKRLKCSITPHPDWIIDNRTGNALYTCKLQVLERATETMRQHRQEIEKVMETSEQLDKAANEKSTD